jgi:hypothetical protein
MISISNKSCRENQNTFYVQYPFFFKKLCCLWDNMEKYCRDKRSQMTTYYGMRLACWITKATHTNSEYLTHCFSTTTMVAQHASMFHSYAHRLSCYLLVTWIQRGTAVHSRCFLHGEVLFLAFRWHTYRGERQSASAGITNIRMLEFSLYHAEPSQTWHTDIAYRIEINHTGVYGGGGGWRFVSDSRQHHTITWLRSCISQTVCVLYI